MTDPGPGRRVAAGGRRVARTGIAVAPVALVACAALARPFAAVVADVDVVRVAVVLLRAGVAVADGVAVAVQRDVEVAVVAVLTDHTAPRVLTV